MPGGWEGDGGDNLLRETWSSLPGLLGCGGVGLALNAVRGLVAEAAPSAKSRATYRRMPEDAASVATWGLARGSDVDLQPAPTAHAAQKPTITRCPWVRTKLRNGFEISILTSRS
ncbi:hypothetical protein HPB47_012764 [Ixodes persulcatus]|uniref:Uncharacterized protein n=1 Tax=Ixodes persulcatus TaxID=34615 RepID=A0AC60NSM4_IXOPE|nr:hypothetical protein HPB47_012764 [Ixodes persulcatus]